MTALAGSQAPPVTSFERLAAFEEALGDPWASVSPLSFAAAVDRDERREDVPAARALLDAAGLRNACTRPLTDYNTFVWLSRLAARRDLTAALYYAGVHSVALPIGLAESVTWSRQLTDVILRGGTVAFAGDPGDHFEALVSGSECVLNGTAECCHNGGAAEAFVVRAQSRDGALLGVVDTVAAHNARIRGPRLTTVGARAADFCPVRFQDVRIPATAVVAHDAAVAEVLERAGDISRVTMAALSVGAADTTLRAVAAFARDRPLYRGTVLDIPHARSLLSGALLDLLACECLVHTASSAVSAGASDARFWCQAVGVFVLDTVGDVLQQLAIVLGARYYLREGHWHGIFEKIVRDHRVVDALFGSTPPALASFGVENGRWNGEPQAVEAGRLRALRTASRAVAQLGSLEAHTDNTALVDACLRRLEARREPGPATVATKETAAPVAFIERALAENQLFSLFQIPLFRAMPL